MNLENEVVLVTGASRGIGKAIAMKLGSHGATVVGTATSDTGASSISAYLKEAGITGRGMTLNVTDGAACQNVVSAVTEQFSAISVLINNAGITRDNLLLRMKDEEWSDIIDTNLSSVFRMSRLCLKAMMKARTGRIINIASVVGSTGNAGQTNYAASKAGMVGFARALAREIGSRGITVNTIAPGFIVSDMTDALSDEQKATLASEIALGRLGTPDEVAMAALYLASDMASYVTGQTLHVNGGMYMG